MLRLVIPLIFTLAMEVHAEQWSRSEVDIIVGQAQERRVALLSELNNINTLLEVYASLLEAERLACSKSIEPYICQQTLWNETLLGGFEGISSWSDLFNRIIKRYKNEI